MIHSDVVIRSFDAKRDAIAEITALLHRAYAPHAHRGLNYVAASQSDDVTHARLTRGIALISESHGRIVATATLYPRSKSQKDSPWYWRSEVAHFGHFAVEPVLQGTGIGTAVIAHLERRARELGKRELALDTAEPAAELIAYYERHGFRHVEYTLWPHARYRSVVLSKAL